MRAYGQRACTYYGVKINVRNVYVHNQVTNSDNTQMQITLEKGKFYNIMYWLNYSILHSLAGVCSFTHFTQLEPTKSWR